MKLASQGSHDLYSDARRCRLTSDGSGQDGFDHAVCALRGKLSKSFNFIDDRTLTHLIQ